MRRSASVRNIAQRLLPRDVTCQTAPGCSMRSGLPIHRGYLGELAGTEDEASIGERGTFLGYARSATRLANDEVCARGRGLQQLVELFNRWHCATTLVPSVSIP